MSSASLAGVKNAVAKHQESAQKHPFGTHSTRICVAISLWICSVTGSGDLSTPDPVVEPPAQVVACSSAESGPANTIGRGIDISRSAGEPSVEDFENLKQQGCQFVIVNGWGGVTRNSHAGVQLGRARSAGLLTAGYCYLNFASPLDGASQVREALTAFGPEAAHLGFLAIDVETSARNQLSQGLRSDPPDASAQQQALARISEAVQHVLELNLRAVIYTKKSDWTRITGDTQQFKNLPLWNPRTIAGDNLTQPELTHPSDAFGGWSRRVGKQYELDTVLSDPPIKVDLNVFDMSAFSPSRSTPSLAPSNSDTRTLAANK